MVREDEVDELVAAWQRERPDVDVSPLQVLSRLARIAAILDGRRAAVLAGHGLALHEFDVLAALRRAGEPFELTPGQLVTATHVTSGTMTNRLERLGARRLVTRRPHPDDGRQVIVRLTALGRRRVDECLDGLLAVERTILVRQSPRQVAELAARLRVLLAAAQD